MTFVNMKKMEELIEHRIMVLINSAPSRGYELENIQRYFRIGGLQSTILKSDLPGWELLGENKRTNRVNKVLRRLIKEGRARMVDEKGEELDVDKPRPWYTYSGGCRVIPLNVLDKMVYALEQDETSTEASA